MVIENKMTRKPVTQSLKIIEIQLSRMEGKKRKNVEKYIKIGSSPKKRDVSLVLPKTVPPKNSSVSAQSPKKSILLQKTEKEVRKKVENPSVLKKTILKETAEDNFVILGKKEKKNFEKSMLSFLSTTRETEKPSVKSSVQSGGNVVLSKQKKKCHVDQNVIVFDDSNISKSELMNLTLSSIKSPQEKSPKLKTEKELKSSLAPFLKVKDKKKNLLSQIMSSEKKTDSNFINLATSGIHGKRLEIKCIVNQSGDDVYVDKEGFFYLQNSSTNVSKSLKCLMSSEGCSAKAMLYDKDKGYIYLKESHNHETDFSETF